MKIAQLTITDRFVFLINYNMNIENNLILYRVRGQKMDIQLHIKAKAPDGVILWSGEEQMTPSSDYVSIGLRKGHVHFAYNLGSGDVRITFNQTRLDDNKWHKIRIQR